MPKHLGKKRITESVEPTDPPPFRSLGYLFRRRDNFDLVD